MIDDAFWSGLDEDREGKVLLRRRSPSSRARYLAAWLKEAAGTDRHLLTASYMLEMLSQDIEGIPQASVPAALRAARRRYTRAETRTRRAENAHERIHRAYLSTIVEARKQARRADALQQEVDALRGDGQP